MTQFLYYFSMGAAGSACMEIFKVYEYRGRLDSSKFSQVAKSYLFWMVTLGMLLASGFITWAINSDSSCVTNLQLLISGVGARAFARSSLGLLIFNEPIQLGDASNSLNLRDLFP